MKVTEATDLYLALSDHLHAECRRQDVLLDTYDHDFVLGTLVAWLGERDLALTGSGVRKIRSVR